MDVQTPVQTVRCGHCSFTHPTVADVAACSQHRQERC